jgi:hypothetical protein
VAHLNVSESLIRRLVDGVVPLVSHLTGWNLRTGDLGTRVLGKNGCNEEIIRRRLNSAGIDLPPKQSGDFQEVLMSRLLEENILAAYDHGGQEIIVVRENVEAGDIDGLRLVLAHELVHRGQHVQHRKVFGLADSLLREAVSITGPEGAATDLARGRLNRLDAIMTLLESHARYVEREVNRLYLPRATVPSHFDMLAFLFQVLNPRKSRQYSDGLPEVANAVQSGKVDSLYEALG